MTFDTLPTATTETETETIDYSEYEPGPSGDPGPSREPRLITQDRLNFIVAELELSKRRAEKLAKFLRQDHVLHPTTKVIGFRNRQKVYQNYFLMNDEKTYAYCNRVPELMREMGIEHNPDEWRLFIDSSTASLKAGLLHVTNKKPSIPVAYSTETSETYDVLKKIITDIKYHDHEWKVCCDLKVVAILQGMQSGYTKHNCFLCDWDSRYTQSCQYLKRDWHMRDEHVPGELNVKKEEIVKKERILLPPLHIKLGIVKNFLKHVYPEKRVAECLHKIFPRLSVLKLKGGKNTCCVPLITFFKIIHNEIYFCYFCRCSKWT